MSHGPVVKWRPHGTFRKNRWVSSSVVLTIIYSLVWTNLTFSYKKHFSSLSSKCHAMLLLANEQSLPIPDQEGRNKLSKTFWMMHAAKKQNSELFTSF